MSKKEEVKKMISLLKESFDKNQLLPNQYVVEYRLTSSDKLLGYHKATSNQLTDELENAKRYSGDNAFSQIEIIQKNLTNTLKSGSKPDSEIRDGLAGMFDRIAKAVVADHFEGLSTEDIYLKPHYLRDYLEPQKFTYTEVL